MLLHSVLALASLLPSCPAAARTHLGTHFPVLPLKIQAISHKGNQSKRQHAYLKLALGWVCLCFVSENGTGHMSSAGQSSVFAMQRGLWGKMTWRSMPRLLPGNFFLLIFAVCCNLVPPKGNDFALLDAFYKLQREALVLLG